VARQHSTSGRRIRSDGGSGAVGARGKPGAGGEREAEGKGKGKGVPSDELIGISRSGSLIGLRTETTKKGSPHCEGQLTFSQHREADTGTQDISNMAGNVL